MHHRSWISHASCGGYRAPSSASIRPESPPTLSSSTVGVRCGTGHPQHWLTSPAAFRDPAFIQSKALAESAVWLLCGRRSTSDHLIREPLRAVAASRAHEGAAMFVPFPRHVELTGRLTPREMHLAACCFHNRTTARAVVILFRWLPQAMTPSPSTFHSIALLSPFVFARRFSLRLRLRSSVSWSIFCLL